MCKRCHDPETGLYPPRVWRNSMNPGQSAISQSSWGFSTMRCGIDSGDHRFRTRLVGVVDVWRDLLFWDGAISSSGGAGSTNPNQSAISQRGWDLHTMRGGIDSEDLRFSPRLVRDVDVWQDFSSGNGTLSSPVAVGATNTSRSAINQEHWGFQTVRGGICLLYTSPSPRD